MARWDLMLKDVASAGSHNASDEDSTYVSDTEVVPATQDEGMNVLECQPRPPCDEAPDPIKVLEAEILLIEKKTLLAEEEVLHISKLQEIFQGLSGEDLSQVIRYLHIRAQTALAQANVEKLQLECDLMR
ncbi:hypothetical protein RSOL_445880 [Rhizoctonia solani AG-3 Rhs1AP]|uniref:Uncharacterized protein n=2 Tax=Rhizoctonia solani AG-3 TaxID=1086053 RepID=A0A074S1N1_9AGAM|nr:hypothetical protein RSOL_445880 [Rhizoctonia solani AG-3 Rhs1AP]KEP50773.1 hypothetical protein V565_073930 [Rhizoctonia solani 123E]